MENTYSPFIKPTEKLESADLEVLRQVSEGWYVEYKSQTTRPTDIAKSLTSFTEGYRLDDLPPFCCKFVRFAEHSVPHFGSVSKNATLVTTSNYERVV